jgi:hypothetical protein
VFGAVTADPPRHDLAPLGDEDADSLNVFVINVFYVVNAETANFSAVEGFFLHASATIVTVVAVLALAGTGSAAIMVVSHG